MGPGNSAVVGLRAVRPEVLRPRLSTGLPLGGAGDSSVTPDVMQMACQLS
jgi:hypothetical protein